LASNASLWIFGIGENDKPKEAGFLVQLDHLNLTSGTKFCRAMSCQKMPENKEQEDKCETLGLKVS